MRATNEGGVNRLERRPFVLFSFPLGPINLVLQHFGVLDQPYDSFRSETGTRLIVSFIQFWMWYGYTMIVLISGVLGINPELFEAAEIDGASSKQTFFYITLPNLRTILLFTLITSMIGGLQMFDIPRLFLNGGPDNSTLTTSLFIYNQAFSGSFLYNRAAAASMIMFGIIVVLSAVVFFIMRDKYAAKVRKEEKKYQREMKKANKASKEVA